MELMDRTVAVDVEPPEPMGRRHPDDQVIVLRGITWDQYVAISDAREENSRPLLAYLDGVLEIVTTSDRHEITKKLLSRLLETFAEERDVSLNGIGNTPYRRKAKAAGLEPDECYCVGKMRARPDVAIEIVHTSGGIRKLEIYRRLGVPEVWFWINGRFWIYRLVGRTYRQEATSTAIPGIDLMAIERIIANTDDDQTDRSGSRLSAFASLEDQVVVPPRPAISELEIDGGDIRRNHDRIDDLRCW